MKNRGLTAYQLKLIAVAAMTLDHIGLWCNLLGREEFGLPLRVVGRIAAPLFLFLMTESLRHTGSRPRLLCRLWLGAVLHASVSALLIRLTGEQEWYGNIFPTLFYVALFVTAVEDAKQGKPLFACVLAAFLGLGTMAASGHGVLSWLFPALWTVEYSALFVALGLAWYFLPGRRAQIAVLLGLSLCSGLFSANAAWIQALGFAPLFYGTQWCMAFAAPLLYVYNGERGNGPRAWFYWYYPLHQYALLLAAWLLGR